MELLIWCSPDHKTVAVGSSIRLPHIRDYWRPLSNRVSDNLKSKPQDKVVGNSDFAEGRRRIHAIPGLRPLKSANCIFFHEKWIETLDHAGGSLLWTTIEQANFKWGILDQISSMLIVERAGTGLH